MKVMALNELISGDMSFYENTWDFVSGESKSTYNLDRLMR
eukprot:gene7487-2528_t